LVNSDVAKAGHAAERFGKTRRDESGSLQEGKRLGIALRDSKVTRSHHVHGHVDGSLAGAFDIEGHGIDMREIVKARAAFCLLGDAA
jgi:hypothetical protein